MHRTVGAIQAGEVPPPLQEELLAGAQDLLAGIECTPDEPPPAGPAETEPPPPAPTWTGEEDDDDDDDDDEDDDD